ncbi:MAG: GNAT family N-acetyltransferase [Candidatus Pacebacteria bacterium]|nr:GNAT family N-acetyltransferase [Candidatus Paceibacterota bacterium]
MMDYKPTATSLSANMATAILLEELHKNAFVDGWSIETIFEMINQPGVMTIVAQKPVDGQPCPVGFLVLRLVLEEAEILTIGVLPAARRNGVARFMMSEATEILRQKRCLSLFLEVAVSNQAAQSLYRGLGFTEVGRRNRYYLHSNGLSEDALVLKRILVI